RAGPPQMRWRKSIFTEVSPMERYLRSILLALVLFFPSPGMARADDDDDGGRGLDHRVAELLERIDAERIRGSVEMLAGFGNRNSCSDTQAPGRGVTPARDWIVAQFSKSKRLTVALDPFVHGNCPTTPTFNVLAWLPGTKHPERVVVVG